MTAVTRGRRPSNSWIAHCRYGILLFTGQWALGSIAQTQVSLSHRFIVSKMKVRSISETHLRKSLLDKSGEIMLGYRSNLQTNHGGLIMSLSLVLVVNYRRRWQLPRPAVFSRWCPGSRLLQVWDSAIVLPVSVVMVDRITARCTGSSSQSWPFPASVLLGLSHVVPFRTWNWFFTLGSQGPLIRI